MNGSITGQAIRTSDRISTKMMQVTKGRYPSRKEAAMSRIAGRDYKTLPGREDN